MQIFEFVKKDILFITREKSVVFIPLGFSLTSTLTSSLLLLPTKVFWIIFIFISIFPPIRIMEEELKKLSLERIISSPIANEIIFISKFISNSIITLFIALSTLVFSIFFLNLKPSLEVILGTIISSLSISSLSTLFSSFIVKEEAKEIMMYVVLTPLITPIVVSVSGEKINFELLSSFFVISFVLGITLFDLKD